MGEGTGGTAVVSIRSILAGGLGPYAETLGLVGSSPPIRVLGERLAAAARSPATVLIQGETGTGKELLARALHRLGPRAQAPFVAHNFGAIADSLVESELFGHARGAFTGAHADRPGLFEVAEGGTLFLDEIGDASPTVQSRLLRALQEGEIRRVGDGRSRRVDVRIVAATHRDLLVEARAGRFRADLYYRLHVLALCAPALRERRGDIPTLVAHAVTHRADREGDSVDAIEPGALALLLDHDWPGNVRELMAVVERALHGGSGRGLLTADAVAEAIGLVPDGAGAAREGTLHAMRLEFEREAIRSALERHGGNRTRAARSLGLTRQGLWKKLRRMGAPPATERTGERPHGPESP